MTNRNVETTAFSPGGGADPLPVDPDLPAAVPRLHRRAGRLLRNRWDIVLAIAAGGALGSLARWGLTELLPHQPGQLAWSTMIENVSGALLIGIVMVFVVDVWPSTRYLRPFWCVGVLGGFTTFSTYLLDTRSLIVEGAMMRAGLYLFGTLFAGLAAVWLGVVLARTVVRFGHHRERAKRKDRERARRTAQATRDASEPSEPRSRR